MLTSREVILAKKEASYGVLTAPTAADDGILIANPSWAHEGLRMNERSVVKNTNAVYQQIFGGTLKTISMDVELKGSGASGVAPEYGVLFEACSMVETVVPGGAVTYDPTSVTADQESITIWYYQDGLLHKLSGCRGTFSLNIETGSIPMATFTITGHSTSPIDLPIVNPVLDATEPVAVKGNAFTIGGYAAAINSMAIDFGVEVITPSSMSASDGFGEVRCGKRDCNGSVDPEMVLAATNNFYDHFVGGDKMAMTSGIIGVPGGNAVIITAPQVYYRDAANGDRDGLRVYEMPIGMVEDAGDDELKIQFI